MGETEDVQTVGEPPLFARVRQLEARVGELDGRVFHGPYEVISPRSAVRDYDEAEDFDDRLYRLEKLTATHGMFLIIALLGVSLLLLRTDLRDA